LRSTGLERSRYSSSTEHVRQKRLTEKKAFNWKKRKPFKRHSSCRNCPGLHHHNTRGDRVRELFKTSKDGESLVVSIFNSSKVLEFCFCLWCHNGSRFTHFWWRHRALVVNAKSQFF